MKDQDLYSELSSIRSLMERSTKFISLSGLSGVMAGVYALTGAFFAYQLVYNGNSDMLTRNGTAGEFSVWWPLFLIAAGILVLSVVTGVWLTVRKARKNGQQFWNPGSKRLFTAMATPLVAGGFFMLIMLVRENYVIIAPASLIFYGLSLVAGSTHTYSDVKWLGYLEISLGLIAALYPGYGLIFWIAGFGLLHIIYGSVMHFKYDR